MWHWSCRWSRIYAGRLQKKRKLLGRKKASYLNQQMAESIGKKSLLKIVDLLRIKKPGLKLPCHESPRDIANQFGEFFCEKGLRHQERFRSCLVLLFVGRRVITRPSSGDCFWNFFSDYNPLQNLSSVIQYQLHYWEKLLIILLFQSRPLSTCLSLVTLGCFLMR